MNPMAITKITSSALPCSNIISAIGEIVESNNWKKTQLYTIDEAESIARKKIRRDCDDKKNTVDFYAEQISNALESSKLTQSQKREICSLMYKKLVSI